jgi:hypothetical protein
LACDNTLEPLSDEGVNYTFYGFLDFDADTNYIRVNDLKKPILEGDTSPFDGIATLEHLEGGESDILVDSVMVYNGISVHNFLTTIPVIPEITYRLTVENSEGKSTSVTHTAITRVEDISFLPEAIEQRTCTRDFTIIFSPVTSGAVILNVYPRSAANEYQYVEVRRYREDTNSITFVLDFRDIGDSVSRSPNRRYCVDHFLPVVRFEYIHVSDELVPEMDASRKYEPGSTGRFGTLYSGEFELEFNF